MTDGVLYRIDHETRYAHADLVSTSQHVACLRPRDLPHQRVHWHELVVEPVPAHQTRRIDYFGNEVTHLSILIPYLKLRASSRSLVEVFAVPAPDPAVSPPWEDVRDMGRADIGPAPIEVEEFRYASPAIAMAPELAAFAREAFVPGRPLLAAAIELMHQIHRECRFDPGATSITTPVTRVLSERHGVCQDFAHLQIACMRSIGLAARYVSGYLLTDPPPGRPRLAGADASHAWLAVWCPQNGWVDLDPTNDVIPDERHITIAWGREYGDVSPLHGVLLGGLQHTLHVGVSVVPATEVTTPERPDRTTADPNLLKPAVVD
jgi:transglutaminase-like putative cysteine protease